MNIKTITCHDVYNMGASLQAHALVEYLCQQGHNAQIIDYKPLYLRHYALTGVPHNSRFNRPLFRLAYQIAKFPGRAWERYTSKRKKVFDQFTEEYLPLTARSYASCEELAVDPPQADVYIVGSDQVWNPIFPNGKDPSFFLTFVPEGKKRISYAASFAVEELSRKDQLRIKPWLSQLDAISVRESSAVTLLKEMGIPGYQVMDPVFILGTDYWKTLAARPAENGYILVYDFDRSPALASIAQELALKSKKKIISLFPMEGADSVWKDTGPLEFLGAVQNADVVLSNSFHATAFSLIFQKDFYVLNREEKINTRMRDLLLAVGLEQRLISAPSELTGEQICWDKIEDKISALTEASKRFLMQNI